MYYQSWENKIYFIGCKHDIFQDYNFSKDSVVIDPHRYLVSKNGEKIIQVGVCTE